MTIKITNQFKKEVKHLLKKYRSLATELKELNVSLVEYPSQGTPLGQDCYKIRLAIKSKKKGKSGGARVITLVKIVQETVFLLSIYDKSEKDDISEKDLEAFINQTDS